MNPSDIKFIIKEYRVSWILNRCFYSGKLHLLKNIPLTEKLFEKRVNITRTDLLEFNINAIKKELYKLNEEKKNKLFKDADDAINGKIIGFSSILLDYGNPIKWNINPLSQIEISYEQKWFSIPDFSEDRGDIKIVWEASRFCHFYLFARAYLLSGDIKYYKAFSEQLDDWLKNNQYGYGPNYKCGQECSLRMINALMVYTIFRQCAQVNKTDELNIIKLIECSYKKILSNFFYADKCIKNNHTLSELCGMIVGAWCSEDEKQLKTAYLLLNKEVETQFFEDGGYTQYSFTYQRFALQLMEFILMISGRTYMELTKDNTERIYKSAMLLFQVMNKEGDIPNYGANDGAMIFPVHSCDYRDFRPVVAGIAALIKRNKIFPDGDYYEETAWFTHCTNTLRKIILKPSNAIQFHKSGYYIFRNNENMAMVCLQNYNRRPGHMDQLHIDIWSKGINILCDCGSYSYATQEGQNLSLTEAHNTAKVYNKEQMRKKGPFFIYGWSKATHVKFSKNSFIGVMESKNGYTHIRRLTKLDNGFVVCDYINENRYHIIFHTPCQIMVNIDTLILLNQDKILAKIHIKDAEIKIKPAYRSVYYLKKEDIKEICIIPRHKKNTLLIEFGK